MKSKRLHLAEQVPKAVHSLLRRHNRLQSVELRLPVVHWRGSQDKRAACLHLPFAAEPLPKGRQQPPRSSMLSGSHNPMTKRTNVGV